MLPGRIEGATHRLGAPRDWDKAHHGPCAALTVRFEPTPAGPTWTSAWYPNADEIERISKGAPIYLTVVGPAHPPIAIAVGAAPD